jgi:hypothetical protein
MRKRIVFLLTLLSLGSQPIAAAQPDVDRLAWLEGTWQGVTGGVAMEETWSSPAGGGLVGMHRDTKAGRMISYEFFRIVARDTSGVCYLASPLGKEPTAFCAIELTDRRVVFENLQHDFPQRVMYWLEPDGRLHARIEGMSGGKLGSQDWIWTRKKAR